MKLGARHTVRASYIGYLTQAITINFTPLLFVTFEESYGISLGKIGSLIGISFLIQLICDGLAARFSSRINTRAAVIAAHLFAVLGMTGLAYLPDIMPDPYIGLIICVSVAAVGGGIIEVFISPIVEAAPTENKSAEMSLLHSFYSWGVASITLLSTLYFYFFGVEHWRLLACLWAIVPAVGAVAFSIVPIYELREVVDANAAITTTPKRERSLWRSPLFWLCFAIMFCGGASEQVMLQWSSAFAESGLHVSKAVGDLLGPFSFAILMGSSRVFYAFMSERIRLRRFITLSSVLCVAAYLLAALSPWPLLSLLGCTLCGLAVGITWPGTLSLGAKNIPFGGVRMFALLAMAGDLGCMVGPTVIGWIAELNGDDLGLGFLVAAIFPAAIVVLSICVSHVRNRQLKKATLEQERT